MKSVTSYGLWYIEATARVAKEAFAALNATAGTGELYLYYKPNGLAFAVAPDAPEGFALVTGERIPGNMTVEQLTFWVRARTGSVPVLPGD